MGGWDRTITILVPVMMFGWIPFTAALFYMIPSRRAILVSVIGGVLFLPSAALQLSGFPDLNKQVVIAISLFIGSFFAQEPRPHLKLSIYDIPMAFWCFVVPVATSVTNGLGIYDGISSSLQNCLNWGIFYYAGRAYFSDKSAIHELCLGIIIGGLLYVPFIFFELRMAPTLSQRIYGFFPHSWSQHVRYGGYRPVVFMRHGLMVSFWMALSATTAYWYWRTKKVKQVLGIPIGIVVAPLITTTILCKSANGWFFLAVGIIAFSFYSKSNLFRFLQLSILIIAVYILFRMFDVISIEGVQLLASKVFDDERVASLTVRLLQEQAFGEKAMQRPLWGWGGYRRAWPVDPLTGAETVSAIDSLWIILFSHYGIMGLVSVFTSFLIGPWLVLKSAILDRKKNKYEKYHTEQIDFVVISLLVLFFVVNSLVNASSVPVYIISAGVLVGLAAAKKRIMVEHDSIVGAGT